MNRWLPRWILSRFSSASRLSPPPHKKISLPEVTLLIYNPEKSPDLSARVLNHVCSGIEFGAVRHLAGSRPSIAHPGEFFKVPPANLNQGQRFQALELNRYFSTSFLLHIEVRFPCQFSPLGPGLFEI